MPLFNFLKKREKPISRNDIEIKNMEEEEEDNEWVVLPALSPCTVVDSVELYRMKRDENFAKKYHIKSAFMSGYEV